MKGGVNLTNQQASWEFQALDPVTGRLHLEKCSCLLLSLLLPYRSATTWSISWIPSSKQWNYWTRICQFYHYGIQPNRRLGSDQFISSNYIWSNWAIWHTAILKHCKARGHFSESLCLGICIDMPHWWCMINAIIITLVYVWLRSQVATNQQICGFWNMCILCLDVWLWLHGEIFIIAFIIILAIK